MSEQPSPQVPSFEKVALLECKVGDAIPGADPLYNLGIVSLNRTILEEGKVLRIEVGFNLLDGVKEPACTFRCTFASTYRTAKSNGDWEAIKEHVAVAHLIPFVREFIWNLTSRMPLGALMIAPMNTHRMVEAFRSRVAEAPSAQ